MPEIAFSQCYQTPHSLIGDDPYQLERFRTINGLGTYDKMRPGRVYTLDLDHPQASNIVAHLNALPLEKRKSLAQVTKEAGEETHALAAFIQNNLDRESLALINTAVASGTQAGRERLNGFQKAVADYQKALLDLRDRMKTDTGPGRGARLAKLRQNARVAFQNLNEQYATELDRYAPEAFRAKNRGTALSNAKRGITLAERNAGSAKVDPHLQVTDMIQASRMRYLAGALNVLGRIAPVADAGLRTHKVTSVREEGGEWLRESVAQMTGFGFAGALGGIAGKATYIGGTAIAAKAGLLLAGPVGWAAVGTILLVTAVTGFTAAYYSDQIGQYIAETLWDWSD